MKKQLSFVFILILLAYSNSSFAQKTFTWKGTSSNNWSNQTNWSIGDGSDGNDGLPTSNDSVVVSKPGECVVNTAAIVKHLKIIASTNPLDDTVKVTVQSGGLVVRDGVVIRSTSTSSSAGSCIAKLKCVGGTLNVYTNIMFEITATGRPERAILNLADAGAQLILGSSIGFSTTGTITCHPSSTITFNGGSTQGIPVTPNITLGNIRVMLNNSNTVRKVFLQGPLTPTNFQGSITIDSATIFDNNGFSIAGNSGKTFTAKNGSQFLLQKGTNLPTGLTLVFATGKQPGSQVTFKGSTTSSSTTNTISGATFDNLTIYGSPDPLTLAGNVVVNYKLSLSRNLTTSSFAVQLENTSPSGYSDSTGVRIIGNFKRKIVAGNEYSYPVGTSSIKALVKIKPNSVSNLNYITVSYNTTGIGSSVLNQTIDGVTFDQTSDNYWTITSDGGSANYNLKIYPFAITGGSAYTIAQRANASSNWSINGTINNDNKSTTGIQSDVNGDYLERDFLTGFGDVVMGFAQNGQLPVVLADFKARVINDAVQLDWKTLSESKSSHFVIERSFDALNFDPIGTVESAGNSSSVLNYSFTDGSATEILSEKVYYRLKQVDKDGQYKYYHIVAVYIGDIIKNSKLFIYPNPASTSLNVNFLLKEKVLLNILNAQGKVLEEHEISDTNNSFDVSGFQKGFYFFKFISNSNSITKKILIK